MITQEQLTQAILDLKESQKETSEQMKDTDERMKDTDERMKETQETLKRVSKLVGNISNNQGDIAEEFFYNSLKAKPSLAGINYDFIEQMPIEVKII